MLSVLKELSADKQKLIEMCYWNNQQMQEMGKAFAITMKVSIEIDTFAMI